MEENTTSVTDAKKIIEFISKINNKLDDSKENAKNLITNITNSSELLVKAQNDNSWERKIFKWSTETLFKLIVESNNATHSSVSSISKLIQNSNDNSKLLADLIGKIAMLSGLSFEKIGGTTAQLEEMAKNLDQNSVGNSEQAGQIKRIILAHINKIKEEKNKAEKIELKFEMINDSLKNLDYQLNTKDIENEQKIAKIKELVDTSLKNLNHQVHLKENENDKKTFQTQELINYNSEDQISQIQKKQKKIINFLAIFSVITFLTLISFIAYYFKTTL